MPSTPSLSLLLVCQSESGAGWTLEGKLWWQKQPKPSFYIRVIQTASCCSIITRWYLNIISSLYPRQLLQYITTKGRLACIGIGEKEFMSLSFPQIVKIQEPGQQHIDFLVAIQYFEKMFVFLSYRMNKKYYIPLISPPQTLLVASDEPSLVSREPLCYIITNPPPGK